MRAWLDLVQSPPYLPEEEGKQSELHRLNPSRLNSDGFLLVSPHMARSIMGKSISGEGDAKVAYDQLGGEIWMPDLESSFTTCKYVDPSKALIRSIQILQDGGKWVIKNERLPLK